jgi:hypothetical protein
MLIALLIVLGVNVIVVVAFASLVFGRRRWLKRQPGAFTGAIRASDGAVDGLTTKWKRGSGRWVRDSLVWSKAPFLFRNEVVPVDRRSGERRPEGGEVKRLGDRPIVVEFASDDTKIEVAAKTEDLELVTGPFTISSSSAPPTIAPV